MTPKSPHEASTSSSTNNNNRNEYAEAGIERELNYQIALSSEIEEVKEDEGKMTTWNGTTNGVMTNEKLDPIKQDEISRLCPSDGSRDEDIIYVAVGKSETSMKALLWALNNSTNPVTTTLYLIHVFPQLKWVPSPLGNGKVPRSQVRKETLDMYIEEETAKRRQLLNKFMDKCNAQKVKVETILIESDTEAKAILELITVLNIQRLVLGVSRSDLRRLRSRRGNGIPDQILQKAPKWCEIKYICEGKDAFEDDPQPQMNAVSIGNYQTTHNSSPNLSNDNVAVEDELSETQLPSFPYCCFKA